VKAEQAKDEWINTLETMLGLKPGQLVRGCYDMDLADECRMLHDEGVNLQDEAAVREACGRRSSDLRPPFPRWVEAIVLAQKGFSITKFVGGIPV
jgi:hypothetical protein